MKVADLCSWKATNEQEPGQRVERDSKDEQREDVC